MSEQLSTRLSDEELWRRIAAPLDPKQIKTKTQGGSKIRYISREDVIYRLNQVCPGEWAFTFTFVGTPQNGQGTWVAKGRLTIRGVTREECGIPANDEHFDPPKAAVSDALKRCASLFGFALELYGEEPPVPGEPKAENGKKGERHWTETQDWKKFYAYASQELDLTHDEVHIALAVTSAKLFPGSKPEADKRLKAYAEAKRRRAASDEEEDRPPDTAWDQDLMAEFWAEVNRRNVQVSALYRKLGVNSPAQLFEQHTPAEARAKLDEAA